jgi:transcriptional antiterminator RfaH
MAFWAVAQIDRRHEALSLHCLALSGHVVYQPRIKSARRESEPLFANYVFVTVEFQWHLIRWSPGVMKLIMAGDAPARVPDQIISDLKAREDRGGLVRLPKRKSLNGGPQFERGDQIKIKDGPMRGFVGLVQDMKPHARIEVLLTMLGALQKVEIAASAVERLA